MNIKFPVILASLALWLGSPAAQAGDLDSLLKDISPGTNKWASVCVVGGNAKQPTFSWHHFQDSEKAVNFWPASTIKVYTVVAALEQLNELELPFNSVVIFERARKGRWVLDTSRAMPEMISEVFRRSSNTDYTLLLRMVGVDRINSRFLIKDRGFPHSALMRGYVIKRPYLYLRTEPQRITVQSVAGQRKVFKHLWSGKSYSKERGATAISAETGNCTSTRELAECLRRIMFHEHLPKKDRYQLTPAQLAFVREGANGLYGLRTTTGYVAETANEFFPKAKFYHKGGWISTYSLDLAYVDDGAHSGKRYVVALAAATGKTAAVKEMSRRIAQWVKGEK